MTASQDLPSGVFEQAVERRLEVERQRIARCYNRTRALFAEGTCRTATTRSRSSGESGRGVGRHMEAKRSSGNADSNQMLWRLDTPLSGQGS